MEVPTVSGFAAFGRLAHCWVFHAGSGQVWCLVGTSRLTPRHLFLSLSPRYNFPLLLLLRVLRRGTYYIRPGGSYQKSDRQRVPKIAGVKKQGRCKIWRRGEC